MMHTLIVTVVVLLVYGAAGVAVLLVYRAGTADPAAPASRATPASPVGPASRVAAASHVPPGDPLAVAEADAARRLVAGRLDAAEYRRIMASLAARDAAAQPVTGLEPPRQDDGPGLR